MNAPGNSEADNAALVARILTGDKGAEAELVERYSRGVRAIIRNNGGRDATEDLCQDAFVIALEKICRGELREPEKLSGFICHLARNLALAHARRATARKKVGIAAAESAISPDPDPLEQIIRQERAELIRRVLAQMKQKRDREILWRFYIDGDDKQQICTELELTDLQFNQVVFRARERFRVAFERFLHRSGGSRKAV